MYYSNIRIKYYCSKFFEFCFYCIAKRSQFFKMVTKGFVGAKTLNVKVCFWTQENLSLNGQSLKNPSPRPNQQPCWMIFMSSDTGSHTQMHLLTVANMLYSNCRVACSSPSSHSPPFPPWVHVYRSIKTWSLL